MQKRVALDSRKRQAIYGALFAPRSKDPRHAPSDSEEEEEDAPPAALAAPLLQRLNGRRVLSVPVPHDLDSSIESPPPRLRPSAPVCGARAGE